MNTSAEFKDIISSKIDLLEKRAFELQKARTFFYDRRYLEVDVPAITKSPAVDAYIDSFKLSQGYLHTSPEYLMKRLLACGMQRIFYIGHVFREEEIGKWHNSEFTMVEWYRVGLSLNALIEEALKFCISIIGRKKVKHLTYRAAFLIFLDLDPFTSDEEQLKSFAKKNGVNFDSDVDKDGWLQLLFLNLIEPKFENDIFYVISQYPKTQAALAKTDLIDGVEVAQRFEIYYNKVELANGYSELNDSKEQMDRFEIENQKRIECGKEPYPISEKFINAVKNLPDCSGVSVGFDRLLMLAYKKTDIKEVIPFSIEEL